MDKTLDGKRIAILATDLVEQVELVEPRRALEAAGAATDLVSLAPGSIQGMNHDEKADLHHVDRVVADVGEAEYDGLLIPGGVGNPDRLRTDVGAVNLVREFFAAGKPIAAICHGPWLLVEADLVRDRTLTSWPSLQTDIRNSGGNWVDREVAVDGGIVTSRRPDDLPAFNAKMIEEFAEGIHARKREATEVIR